jgi:hypothetical protein
VAGEHHPPRSYRPHDGVTLFGPFWTRRQVAAYLGATPSEVRRHPTLFRIEGALSAEEVYPSFQFGDGSATREVTFLARLLKRRVTDVEACDWLLRVQRRLDNRTPIAWLAVDGDVDRIVRSLPQPSRPVPGVPSSELDGDDMSALGELDRSSPRPAAARWSPRPIAH